MTQSVNKAIILGNIGRDPEIRDMANGKQMLTLSVATTQEWHDKQTGEKKARTEWHTIVIFNEALVKIARPLTKGTKIYIEGEIQTRKWEDKATGQPRYKTEIVLNGFHNKIIICSPKHQHDSNIDF